mgnify:CR=1 FL=1
MPRYLGKLHVYENCFYSTYGRRIALKYGENIYCDCGEAFYTINNKPVQGAIKCSDWLKCKGLAKISGEHGRN